VSAHTPGPWRRKVGGNLGNAIEAFSGKHIYDNDDGFRTVAMFQSCEATGFAAQEDANAAANGRLIAAAPDGYALAVAVAARFADTDAPLGQMARDLLAKVNG